MQSELRTAHPQAVTWSFHTFKKRRFFCTLHSWGNIHRGAMTCSSDTTVHSPTWTAPRFSSWKFTVPDCFNIDFRETVLETWDEMNTVFRLQHWGMRALLFSPFFSLLTLQVSLEPWKVTLWLILQLEFCFASSCLVRGVVYFFSFMQLLQGI